MRRTEKKLKTETKSARKREKEKMSDDRSQNRKSKMREKRERMKRRTNPSFRSLSLLREKCAEKKEKKMKKEGDEQIRGICTHMYVCVHYISIFILKIDRATLFVTSQIRNPCGRLCGS